MALSTDLLLLLSDEQFQQLCYRLAQKEFPLTIPLATGSWDQGCDALVFNDDAGDVVWQCKFTRRSLSTLKPTIRASFNALTTRPIAKWILCVPLDPSGVFLTWLHNLCRSYPFIATCEVWGKTLLMQRLEQHSDVFEAFFQPLWQTLAARFHTDALELVRYDLAPGTGWWRSETGTLHFLQHGDTRTDLVLDIIVRSRGSLQSLIHSLRLELHDVRRHLRGVSQPGVLQSQWTYEMSLRGGAAGTQALRLEPPLLVNPTSHQRFSIRLTNAGYAWTGYLSLILFYGNDEPLRLPITFLSA